MKTSPTRLMTLMALAIALNFIGANFALMLKLPIYLDTLGTLLIAVLFGPWYGMLTAALSAILSWITTDIFAIYYAPVALIIAFIAGWLFHNKPKQEEGLLLKTLLISLPSTIVSAAITVILFNGITSSGSSLIAQLLHGLGLDMTVSLVLVQAVTDFLDRLLCLGLVVVLAKILQKQLQKG